jgi:hypothetical protein
MPTQSDLNADDMVDDEDHQKHLEVVENGFRSQFEKGDVLALLDCIRWCDSYGLSIPVWVRSELSKASNKYLSGDSDNFHDALFGERKKIGRHSKPSRTRLENRRHQLTFDLVFALRQRGFKGDRLYDRAKELLPEFHVDSDNRLIYKNQEARNGPDNGPEIETIKKRVEQMKRDGARPSGFAHMLLPMIPDLDQPPRRKK